MQINRENIFFLNLTLKKIKMKLSKHDNVKLRCDCIIFIYILDTSYNLPLSETRIGFFPLLSLFDRKIYHLTLHEGCCARFDDRTESPDTSQVELDVYKFYGSISNLPMNKNSCVSANTFP